MKLHKICAIVLVTACSLATAEAADKSRAAGAVIEITNPVCQAAFDRLDDIASNPARTLSETTQQHLVSGLDACRTAKHEIAAARLEQIIAHLATAVR